MSYQTTMARAQASAADREWREHLAHCPACATARDGREWDLLCGHGAILRDWQRETASALVTARKLDRAPSPGQGVLEL